MAKGILDPEPRGKVDVPCFVHDWEGQPTYSDDDVQRYLCRSCKRWGFRQFDYRAGTFTPIKIYADHRKSPDPSWEGNTSFIAEELDTEFNPDDDD